MPKVEDIFSPLNGAKDFSTLDLWCRIPPYSFRWSSSIPRTAFTSPVGKYEYIKVPFGLALKHQHTSKNSWPGILKDFNFAIAYLDDIIIFSRTVEEHLDHIKQVSEKLRSDTPINETQQMPLLH